LYILPVFFLFAKKAPTLYPYPRTTLPKKEEAIYDHLSDFLGIEHVEGKPTLVALYGTSTYTPYLGQLALNNESI
jgi:hypothetical protein